MKSRNLTFPVLWSLALLAAVASARADHPVGLAISSEGSAAQFVSYPANGRSFGRATKVTAGTVIRTPAHRTVIIQLLPGYAVGVDQNSELLITTLDESPLGALNAKRTMSVELRSGRMAGLLERYYPERTVFHTSTVNGLLSNESQGLFVISTDGKCTRDVQVEGNALWTTLQRADHPTLRLRTNQVMHCCPDHDLWLGLLDKDAQAIEDKAFGIAMLRQAVQLGILDANAFPYFAADLVDLQNDLRDRLLNPANYAGLILNPFNSPHIDTFQPPPPLGAEPPIVTPDPVSPKFPGEANPAAAKRLSFTAPVPVSSK